jgi:hypothetical protein
MEEEVMFWVNQATSYPTDKATANDLPVPDEEQR